MRNAYSISRIYGKPYRLSQSLEAMVVTIYYNSFTEAEDIMFGTVSVDDLEPYEEQDDDTLIHQADAVKQKDFREHRLSRPRSIRSAHSSLNRSSTWSSYRSSLARKLDPTSVESSVDKLVSVYYSVTCIR